MQVGRTAGLVRSDLPYYLFIIYPRPVRDRSGGDKMGIKGVEHQAILILDSVINDDRAAKQVINNIYYLAIEQRWDQHAGSKLLF